MKQLTRSEWLTMVGTALLVSACWSSARPTAVPTTLPASTATMMPTATAVAENTSTPTVVLAPTATPADVATVVVAAPPVAQKDIMATAGELGTVAIFLEIMEATGLAAKLHEPGPFTVFIPVDSAFEVIPKFMRDRILSSPDSNASQALLSLVVPGTFTAAMLTDGLALQPVQGNPLQVTQAADGSIMVNEVKIMTTDIVASNGVIHIIDSLILPEGLPFGR